MNSDIDKKPNNVMIFTKLKSDDKTNNYTISGGFSQVKNVRNGTLQLLKNDWKLIGFCCKTVIQQPEIPKIKMVFQQFKRCVEIRFWIINS